MSKEDDELPSDVVAGWQADSPPNDFVDSVMNAVAGIERPVLAPRSSHARLWGFSTAAVALLGLGVGWMLSSRDSGVQIAEQRQTLELGGRAVAVLEAGSHVRWDVSAWGGAEVLQEQGNVFYRVESGRKFVVRTAAGNIEVRGTCFRVEVTEMDTNKKTLLKKVRNYGAASAAGALFASAVVVTVYEGEVALANDQGTTVLEAGQVASAQEGAKPSDARTFADGPGVGANPIDADGRTTAGERATKNSGGPESHDAHLLPYAQLHAAYQAQRQELAALKKRLGSRHEDDAQVGSNKHIYPADADKLLELAKSCAVQTDSGPTLGTNDFEGIGDDAAEEMSMTSQEREAFDAAVRRLRDKTRELLVRNYLDLGGTQTVADELGTWSLYSQIQRFNDDEHPHKLISKERAGLVPPRDPSRPMSPKEEAVRWVTGLGDALQQEMAKAVGAERAHELRAKNGGWLGGRSTWSGCHESDK